MVLITGLLITQAFGLFMSFSLEEALAQPSTGVLKRLSVHGIGESLVPFDGVSHHSNRGRGPALRRRRP
jgi:hypothetical protein